VSLRAACVPLFHTPDFSIPFGWPGRDIIDICNPQKFGWWLALSRTTRFSIRTSTFLGPFPSQFRIRVTCHPSHIPSINFLPSFDRPRSLPLTPFTSRQVTHTASRIRLSIHCRLSSIWLPESLFSAPCPGNHTSKSSANVPMRASTRPKQRRLLPHRNPAHGPFLSSE
jgi:hypothetical protein